MSKAPSTETFIKRPEPDTLFTDRDCEREVLRKVICPQPPPDSKDMFLTVFYGTGGVGKSALSIKAMEIATEHKPVFLAAVDFDIGGRRT